MKPPCDEGQMLGGRCAGTSPTSGRWVLVATILGSSMAFIDGTVVNVALPAVQQALAATATEVQWVVESYALLLAALLLVGGSLGDRYGRRKVFVAGVVVFAAGSGWCGFAPGILSLIVARGVQGIGAAMLVPGSLALISASFPAETRGKAIGTWSGSTAITAAIGPVMGGWLVQHATWRWVFFLNLPLAAVVVAVSVWRVPESRNEQSNGAMDWAGASLVTIGLGGVTYGLIEHARGGWIVGLGGVCGIVALAAFLLVERTSQAPMVSLELFRSRSFSGANLLTLFLYAALGGALFFLPLNLIQVQHYPPTAAGASLLPLIVLMFLLSRWSGGLVARFGARLPLTVGPVIAAIGFALLLTQGLGGRYWTTLFPAVLVLGLGLTVSVAPLTTTVMNAVPPSQSGVASGVNNALSRSAGLLAIAVMGLVLISGFNRGLDRRLPALGLSAQQVQQADRQRSKLAGAEIADPRVQRAFAEAFVDGYRLMVLMAVGLALASAASAWWLLKGDAATWEKGRER